MKTDSTPTDVSIPQFTAVYCPETQADGDPRSDPRAKIYTEHLVEITFPDGKRWPVCFPDEKTARLFSAVPEAFAALETAKKWNEYGANGRYNPRESAALWENFVQLMETAFAKRDGLLDEEPTTDTAADDVATDLAQASADALARVEANGADLREIRDTLTATLESDGAGSKGGAL